GPRPQRRHRSCDLSRTLSTHSPPRRPLDQARRAGARHRRQYWRPQPPAGASGRGGRPRVALEPGGYAFARPEATAAANPELLSRLVLIQAALTADVAAPANEETVRFYSRWPLRGRWQRPPSQASRRA